MNTSLHISQRIKIIYSKTNQLLGFNLYDILKSASIFIAVVFSIFGAFGLMLYVFVAPNTGQLIESHMRKIKNLTSEIHQKHKCYPVSINALHDPKIFKEQDGNSCGKTLKNNDVNLIKFKKATVSDNELHIDLGKDIMPIGQLRKYGNNVVYVVSNLPEKLKQKVIDYCKTNNFDRYYNTADIKNPETVSKKYACGQDIDSNPVLFIGYLSN